MSAQRDWVNEVCDLEEQGRFDEAQLLIEANTSAKGLEGLKSTFATLAEQLKRAIGIGRIFGHVPEQNVSDAQHVMDRFKSARELPDDHPTRLFWGMMGNVSPFFIAAHWAWRRFPDPLARQRGRPKGTWSTFTVEMFEEMNRLTGRGGTPTKAAKYIIGPISGVRTKTRDKTASEQQKDRADALVKAWKAWKLDRGI